MQNPFEQQIRNELRSEIEALEKNYAIIKDVLSGAKYDVSDIKGTLQSFKDNLSKVMSLAIVLSQMKGSRLENPFNPLLNQVDFALTLIELYPHENPSSILQLSLALSNIKIENVMSLVSILKKMI